MAGFSFNRSSLEIDGCQFTLVSDVVQDPVSGKYVRTIQFYTDAVDTLNPRPILEILLSGDTAIAVELQTPKLNF